MLDILEIPAVRARVPAFSVEQYHRLAVLEELIPDVELIRGALFPELILSLP